MQMKNNFSSSISFNINYLVDSNNCINTHTHTHTHTHSNNGLSLCTKAIAVRPARVSVRRFKHLQGAFKVLCRCFFVCVIEPVKQEINSSKYNHLNRTKNEEKNV